MRRVLLFALLAATACGASPGGPIDPEDPAGQPTGPTLETPLLSMTPDDRTYHESTAIAGTGPASGTVFIDTEVDGTIARPIGEDGSFCVEIPLRKNAVNVLGVHVADLGGAESPTREILVTQLGDPPRPPPEAGINAASSATVTYHNLTLVGGNEAMAVDNDPTTVADFQEQLTASGGYRIRIGFGHALEPVSAIRISSPTDCAFKAYDLYASAMSNASDDPTSPEWVKIPISVDGDGLDEATLSAPMPMTHLMLVPSLPSCELGVWNRDHYKISDISAIAHPDLPAIAPQQSCGK